MKTYLFYLSAIILTFLIAPVRAITESSGAYCSGTISYTYYCSPTGNDNNSGLDTSNPKTLSGCITIAQNNKNNGTGGTRVILMDGIYRTEIYWVNQANQRYINASLPTIFEAQNLGQATISGANEFNSWTDPNSDGIWEADWTNNWGTGGWPYGEPSNDLPKRQEMVYVNGALMRQVLSFNDLSGTYTYQWGGNYGGNYYVDEAANKLYLKPPAGVNPNTADTEVGVRMNLLELHNTNNVTLRGLNFTYDCGPVTGDPSCSRIINCSNVLVEDCNFNWASWTNLGILYSNYLTLRRVNADHAGAMGLTAYLSWDILYEDVSTCYCNWRGDWGDYRGNSIAGIKDAFCHRLTYRDFKSCNNMTGGYWMDTDGRDIILERCTIMDNHNERNGVFIEVCPGPFLVKHCVIARNGGGGIRSVGGEYVTVEKNVFYGNHDPNNSVEDGQIAIVGDNGELEIYTLNEATFSTGSMTTVRTENWTLTDNTFVCTNSAQQITSVGVNEQSYEWWSDSLTADYNVYYAPISSVFGYYNTSHVSSTTDFTGWKAYIGGGTQETHSVWQDPRFTDAANSVFQPIPWRNIHMGYTTPRGYAYYSPTKNIYSIGSSGANVSHSSDQCQFVYVPFKFINGEIKVRVLGFDNTHSYAKAGVMIRESLAVNSRFATLTLQPEGGGTIYLQQRTSTGGFASTVTWDTYTYGTALYLRLLYDGTDAITAYTSTDGNNWDEVGTTTVSLGSQPYIGLVVTSYDTTKVCNATFDNIYVAGALNATSGTGGADCHVRGDTLCDTNYGTNQYLTVQNASASQSSNNILGYARIDLSQVPAPADKIAYGQFALRTAVANGANEYNFTVWGLNDGFLGGGSTGLTYRSAAVVKIDEDDWAEGSLTWRNAPGNTINAYAVNTNSSYGNGNVGWAYNSTSLGTFTLPASAAAFTSRYISGGVGSALVNFLRQDTNGKVTFIITRNEVNNSEATNFAAKEHATYGAGCPYLYVNYTP